MLTPFLGLAAALVWGASDFCGGLSAKRASTWWVVLLSQVVGLIYLVTLAFLLKEKLPPHPILLTGMLAGLIGEFGLVMLYQGLASGRMGIVAPLSALTGAILPALFSWRQEGLPSTIQLSGILLALPAVWLVSASSGTGRVRRLELALGLFSGLAFGIYFILIGQVSSQSIYWSLTAARFSSLVFLIGLIWIIRPIPRPAGAVFWLIALVGFLDTSGNVLYALATRFGRLDIAAVLASLYPATTILLAYTLLKERLGRAQWAGVALALTVVALLSACTAPGTPLPAPLSSPTTIHQPVNTTTQPRPERSIEFLTPGQAVNLTDIHITARATGWGLATDTKNSAHILVTFDDGNHWQDVTPPEPGPTPRQDGKHALAFFYDSTHAWVIYYTTDQETGPLINDRIWITQDGGQTWSASAPLDLSDWEGGYSQPAFLDFPNPDHGFLALRHDPGAGHVPMSIYRTMDGGIHWGLARGAMSSTGNDIDVCCQTGMAFLDANHGIITMQPGPIGRTYWTLTQDGGFNWQAQDVPPIEKPIFASGMCETTSPTARPPRSLDVVVDCLQEAIPGQAPPAFLYSTTDYGQNWVFTMLPGISWDAENWTYLRRTDQVQMINAEEGWLSTRATYEKAETGEIQITTTIYRTSDGGKTWQTTKEIDHPFQQSFLDAHIGWLLQLGEPTKLLVTQNGGSSWETITPQVSD
jgi:drug/metabolite transporter (DMT)-like permease/photosystem II stability/assembly factor-like uncharacterized protein